MGCSNAPKEKQNKKYAFLKKSDKYYCFTEEEEK